jgi:uncharacterized membrane protein
MFRKSFDLILVILITGLMAGLILTHAGNSALLLALALPCVFLFPGYALVAAIFPENARQIVEQVTLALGLSLITVILGGFVLNWTPWGLSAEGWAVWVSGVTVFASGLALLRRRALPPMVPLLTKLGFSKLQMALFGLAAVVGLLAVQVARMGAFQQPTAGFTQLWVLPGDQAVSQEVRIGVSNMEGQAFTYRLCLSADAVAVGDCQEVTLEGGATWGANLEIPLAAQKVEATLFRVDLPNVIYRYVIYWPNEQE